VESPIAHAPILIVEDDDDVRTTMRDVVMDEGYTVVEAANGAEALAYLRANPRPCLVLLDLMMPVCNGFEFLDRVRDDSRLKTLPVLVVSAARDRLSSAASDAVVGVLAKPVELETLLEVIQRHC
jgi:CheY-like chemotaxis protein